MTDNTLTVLDLYQNTNKYTAIVSSFVDKINE